MTHEASASSMYVIPFQETFPFCEIKTICMIKLQHETADVNASPHHEEITKTILQEPQKCYCRKLINANIVSLHIMPVVRYENNKKQDHISVLNDIQKYVEETKDMKRN